MKTEARPAEEHIAELQERIADLTDELAESKRELESMLAKERREISESRKGDMLHALMWAIVLTALAVSWSHPSETVFGVEMKLILLGLLVLQITVGIAWSVRAFVRALKDPSSSSM